MAWSVSADVEQFDAAVEWFRHRMVITDAEIDRLDEPQRLRAFRIANVTELRIAQDVFTEIELALAEGLPIEEFRKNVAERIADWAPNRHHLDTIFITATQDAYNAGRYREMSDPAITNVRPYRMYDSVLDGRTTEICRDRDEVVKPHDDPWWQQNWPPNHFRCRAGVRTLTQRQAQERGITDGIDDPLTKPTDGFGQSPDRRPSIVPEPPARRRFDSELYSAFEQRDSRTTARVREETENQ